MGTLSQSLFIPFHRSLFASLIVTQSVEKISIALTVRSDPFSSGIK